MSSPTIIDFHTHAFPDAIAPVALEKLSATSGLAPGGDGTAGGLLASMERCGVAASVVHSIATAPRQAESIRQWCLAIRSPRIIPFPSVHPDSPGVEEELATLAADGFRGIKLHPEYQGFHFDDDRMGRLYDTCRRLGLIIFFHAGDDISFPKSDRGAPRRLARVRDAYPGLVLVAAHTGGWRRWDEAGEYLAGKDVYFDVGYTRGYLPDGMFRELLLAHRSDRLLFGSDYPWDDQGEAADHMRALGLPESVNEALFHGNAQRLLGLKG